MSGMDLDDELLRAAGRKQSSARKQKRARKDLSESEEEVSEEEELELSDDDDAPAKYVWVADDGRDDGRGYADQTWHAA